MSVDRGLDILEYLATTNTSHSLEHLSKQLDIPRTSCFRIIKVLEARGYIQLAERVGRMQEWELTYKLNSFGSLLLKDDRIASIALSSMQKLAEETDLFVQLGVVSNRKVLYIEDVKRPKLLQVYAPKWSYLELHACAAGLVLMAHMSEAQLQAIVQSEGLPKKTNNTITTMGELEVVLQEIRKQNYAIDKEYYALGISCVAAPIYDQWGSCLAAVGVTGSIDEFQNLSEIIERVKASATEISEKMGFNTSLVND